MYLSPEDEERLLIFMTAELARRRKERGVKLNYPETVAYLSNWMCERARDGEDVPTIRSEVTAQLEPDDVMDGIPSMTDIIQVEPVFPDGQKLVTVYNPIRGKNPKEDQKEGQTQKEKERHDQNGNGGDSDDGGNDE